MNFEAMEYETRRKELNALTFDTLKEMCVERHVDFGGKNKAELIDLLSEFVELKSGDLVTEVTAQPEVNVQIMKMLMQMQEVQVRWLEQQQKEEEKRKKEEDERRKREEEDRIAKEKELKRQEEREMEKMEKEQRFLSELMKELADSKKEKDAVKLPKPVLQKFTEGDDIESFLDMFERVASLHKWPRTIWATQLAGVLSGKALKPFSSLNSH